jgi:phosphoglycerate dehydrogenase-like enzyme
MDKHRTLFLTQRGERHQQNALAAAPPELEIVMRRDAARREILELVPDVEFLISERTGVIDAELVAAGRRLKLIQRLGSQTWDIDLDAARRAGIPVCYLPVRTCVMVAEHMVLQMLTVAKRARELMQIVADAGDWGPPRRCDEDYFAYNWSRRRDIRSISGATVSILGFGEIGLELARRLRGFDCRLLYLKRARLPAAAEAELGIRWATRDELLRESDFVCSLLPLFPETALAIDATFFAALKPGAQFVHCGAGGVVDEGALIAALRSGRLRGAALDTYVYEPMRPDDPLLALARDPTQNLLLTPHVGAGPGEADSSGRVGDYRNLRAVLDGAPLQYRLV